MSLVRRPILALEGLACPPIRAAAYIARPSRRVDRRATDRGQVVGSSPARGTGSKRDSVLVRARALLSASVRLRANEALQLTGAPSIAVERLDTDTLINLRRAW